MRPNQAAVRVVSAAWAASAAVARRAGPELARLAPAAAHGRAQALAALAARVALAVRAVRAVLPGKRRRLPGKRQDAALCLAAGAPPPHPERQTAWTAKQANKWFS